eukprot:COSAG01_NODE_8981_length_2594_cov_1.975160_3_plen_49_part_01
MTARMTTHRHLCMVRHPLHTLRRQARDRLNRLSQEAQVATVHDGEGEAV